MKKINRPPGYSRGDENRERVYQYIKNYYAQNGISPSFPEIAAACNLTNGGVRRIIISLQKYGRLTWIPNHHRSIRLLVEVE